MSQLSTQGPNLLPCLAELEGAGFCRGAGAASAPSGPGTQPPPSSSYLKEVSPKPLACISRVLNAEDRRPRVALLAHRYPLVTGRGGGGGMGVREVLAIVGLWGSCIQFSFW